LSPAFVSIVKGVLKRLETFLSTLPSFSFHPIFSLIYLNTHSRRLPVLPTQNNVDPALSPPLSFPLLAPLRRKFIRAVLLIHPPRRTTLLTSFPSWELRAKYRALLLPLVERHRYTPPSPPSFSEVPLPFFLQSTPPEFLRTGKIDSPK